MSLRILGTECHVSDGLTPEQQSINQHDAGRDAGTVRIVPSGDTTGQKPSCASTPAPGAVDRADIEVGHPLCCVDIYLGTPDQARTGSAICAGLCIILVSH